jgi:hypothetical protein
MLGLLSLEGGGSGKPDAYPSREPTREVIVGFRRWRIGTLGTVVRRGGGIAARGRARGGKISVIAAKPSPKAQAMPHALLRTRRIELFRVQQKAQR